MDLPKTISAPVVLRWLRSDVLRARARTSWPLANRRSTKALPTNPVLPVTSVFIMSLPLADAGLCFLEWHDADFRQGSQGPCRSSLGDSRNDIDASLHCQGDSVVGQSGDGLLLDFTVIQVRCYYC